MGEAFRMGGWGMYPTAIAGFVLVACAIRYAVAPDARRSLLVRRLSMLTFLVGTLGFITGCMKNFTHVQPKYDWQGVIVHGIGESLNCIGLALVSLVMAGIASSIGAARLASDSAELVDPQ